MKFLTVIPARKGSKGIPNKNIKLLDGKPLIQYSIETSRQIFKDEDICLSTDSDEIIELANNLGLKTHFKRPDHLATDKATTHDVLIHALDYYSSIGKNYDALVLMQPTSPFRIKKHVEEAMALYNSAIDMVVSVKETSSNPYYVLFEENEKGYLIKSKSGNYKRRQDCPKVWEYNGAVYIINIKSLKERMANQFDKVIKYIMDDESSLDLDTPLDWKIAEFLIENHKKCD